MPDLPIRLAVTLIALWPAAGFALPADLCDQAAERAARASGIPPEILLALTRTETGRDGPRGIDPWPWAVNHAGQGHWFDTAALAEAYVAEQIGQGAGNLDIGCFQLNYRWHGAAFASLADMFDPDRNATYAADYLASHYQRTGDWITAAGAYHSATEAYATRYMARFSDMLDTLSPLRLAAVLPQDTGGAVRQNRYPLLAGGQGAGGSLVPRSTGGPALFGGRLP